MFLSFITLPMLFLSFSKPSKLDFPRPICAYQVPDQIFICSTIEASALMFCEFQALPILYVSCESYVIII